MDAYTPVAEQAIKPAAEQRVAYAATMGGAAVGVQFKQNQRPGL